MTTGPSVIVAPAHAAASLPDSGGTSTSAHGTSDSALSPREALAITWKSPFRELSVPMWTSSLHTDAAASERRDGAGRGAEGAKRREGLNSEALVRGPRRASASEELARIMRNKKRKRIGEKVCGNRRAHVQIYLSIRLIPRAPSPSPLTYV